MMGCTLLKKGTVILVIGSLIALISCSKPQDGAPGLTTTPGADDPTPLDPPMVLTEARKEQLIAFGTQFAEAMSKGDDATMRAGLDIDALFDRAMGASVKKSPTIANQLREGFKTGHKDRPGGILWANFGAPWRFLRFHEDQGQPRLLCRFIASGGVGYLNLVPQFDASGEPKIVDIYVFASGEYLSETYRRLMVPQFARATQTPIEKLLSGSNDPVVAHMDDYLSMCQSIETGNFAEAASKYQSFPPKLQDVKQVLIIYMAATVKSMDSDPKAAKRYEDSVMRFKELYGDDPAFLLMGIDYHYLRGEFEESLQAVERLDAAVGGDPYLNFMRASVLIETAPDEALGYAQKAVAAEPEYEQPYWAVVTVELARKNWSGVGKALDSIIERFGYDINPRLDPTYGDFVASPEGKAWMSAKGL